MKEYQFWAYDKERHLLHAGPHKLGRFSIKTIRKLERKWMGWRYNYIKSNPGDYPLAQDANKVASYVVIRPIGGSKRCQTFILDS